MLCLLPFLSCGPTNLALLLFIVYHIVIYKLFFHLNHVTGVCLLSQLAHEKHKLSRKKKVHIPLRTTWISQKMCLPCLIIIKACVFLTIEWTNLSHVLTVWSVFRALLAWSRRTTYTKDHRLFYLDYTHKSMKSENLIWSSQHRGWMIVGCSSEEGLAWKFMKYYCKGFLCC